jgi:rubrerythrin
MKDLALKEVLALAVEVERSNARRFRAFASTFAGYDEEVSRRFEELAEEEVAHEARLVEWYGKRFADPLPEIGEFDVEGVVESIDLDDAEHLIFGSLDPDEVFRLALEAERRARSFYRSAARSTRDQDLRRLLEDLARMEEDHAGWLEERAKS